jgi:hypothetical protein
MMRMTAGGVVIAFGIRSADAHDFVLRYDLPVPFGLYLYACAATLVVYLCPFGLVPAASGWSTVVAHVPCSWNGADWPSAGMGDRTAAGVGLACFGLTVAAGLVGTKNPDTNIGPTLFWHGFLLGLMYATALVGDVYAFLNPWKSIVEWVQRRKTDSSQPLVAYPPARLLARCRLLHRPHLDRALHTSGTARAGHHADRLQCHYLHWCLAVRQSNVVSIR